MLKNRYQFVFIIAVLGCAEAKFSVDQVKCIKNCVSNLGNSLISILSNVNASTYTTNGVSLSTGLSNYLQQIENGPNFYRESSNFKSWCETVITMFKNVFLNQAMRGRFNGNSNYFSDQFNSASNSYKSCSNSCELGWSNSDPMKGNFSSFKSSVIKEIQSAEKNQSTSAGPSEDTEHVYSASQIPSSYWDQGY